MHIKIDNELRMEFQTDLRPVFNIIKEYSKNLVWLISYHEFQYLDNKSIDKKLNPLQQLIKISGEDLIEIIEKNKIQFIWGVLSGCENIPDIKELDFKKLNLKNHGAEEYVYDDALTEIDCFDSTFTIVRSKNKDVLELLSEYFETDIKSN
jgi:hypothetical protein